MLWHVRTRTTGFSLIDTLVALVLIAIMVIALTPLVKQQITDAHIEETIKQARHMAFDATLFVRSRDHVVLDDNDHVKEIVQQQLPEMGGSQIHLFNEAAGTNYPNLNYFKRPYFLQEAPGDATYVIAITTIPAEAIADWATHHRHYAGVVIKKEGDYYALYVRARTDANNASRMRENTRRRNINQRYFDKFG